MKEFVIECLEIIFRSWSWPLVIMFATIGYVIARAVNRSILKDFIDHD